MKRHLLALVLWPVAAAAHDPGLSSATVDFSSREILVQLAFAPADLTAGKSPAYAHLAPRSVELRTENALVAPSSVEIREVGANDVEFILRFPKPPGEAVLRSPLLASMPFGHRQALVVRDLAGVTVRTEMLSANRDAVSLPAPAPLRARSTTSVSSWFAASADFLRRLLAR